MRRQLELCEIIGLREEWLMQRTIDYALRFGFTDFTATLAEAWRMSVAHLSQGLIEFIQGSESPRELGPLDDYRTERAYSFVVHEARRHRERGIKLTMFLGLLKYYRQSYMDLAELWEQDRETVAEARQFITRFFDRLELAFCSEWMSITERSLIEELQAANREMVNEKNKFLTVFESLGDPVFLLDALLQIENLNLSAAQLLEHAASSGASYYGTRTTQRLPWFGVELARFVASDKPETRFEASLDTGAGPRDFEVRMQRMLDVTPKFAGTTVMLHDITERNRAQETIRRLAYQDSLTGLPNRTVLQDRLTLEIARSSRHRRPLAVMLMDLDHFKDVNDTLGHAVGDMLLQEVGVRVRAALRQCDTLARMGGDEFVVLLPDIESLGDVRMIADRIHEAFDASFICLGHPLRSSASLGTAMHPDDGLNSETLLRKADIAMYVAKRRGRRGWVAYAPELESPRDVKSDVQLTAVQ